MTLLTLIFEIEKIICSGTIAQLTSLADWPLLCMAWSLNMRLVVNSGHTLHLLNPFSV